MVYIIEQFKKDQQWVTPDDVEQTVVINRDNGETITLTNDEIKEVVEIYNKKWRI